MNLLNVKLKQAGSKLSKHTNGFADRGLVLAVIVFAVLVTLIGGNSAINAAPPRVVAPVVTFTANPSSTYVGNSSTLTWSATNSPTSCTASNSWSGTKASSGSASSGAFKKAANFKYTLACTNSGGTGTTSVTIAVTAAPPPAPVPTPAPSPTPTPTPVPPPAPTPTPPPAPAPSPTPTPAPEPTPTPTPSPAPTPAPSPTPPPPAPTPPPTVVGVPYTCSGPVNNVFVTGTGSSTVALLNLKSGCTGNLSFDVTITSGGGDGVKVQAGAHDLNIGPSKIVCQPGVDPSAHQDGVQVQGGTNVVFHGLKIVCPYVSGNGAGAFYVNGSTFAGINNVICDGCNLEHSHGALTYNEDSVGHKPVPVNSGAMNSILHQNQVFHDYSHIYTINSLTLNAGFLDFNNTHVPDCDDSAANPC